MNMRDRTLETQLEISETKTMRENNKKKRI